MCKLTFGAHIVYNANNMDQNLENEIISALEIEVEASGSSSIKQVAQKMFYNNITLSEQKKLAKLIVKKHPFVTELKNGEIIVKKNLVYSESINDTEERYGFLTYIIWAIAAAAAYLVFKVLLPSLSA